MGGSGRWPTTAQRLVWTLPQEWCALGPGRRPLRVNGGQLNSSRLTAPGFSSSMRSRFTGLSGCAILDLSFLDGTWLTLPSRRSTVNRDARAPALIAWIVAVLLAPIPSLVLAQDVQAEQDAILPLDEISPGYLGMYKKLMLIEDDIRRYSEQYGVDFDLARAVCLYESGGNRGLTSVAGAQGYFQVMPATFRSLRVKTNIEAGVKYLGQLVNRFDREDYAVAAYNTGPARVARRRPMPLETLQYVFGVGHFRAVLKQHGRSVRFHAEQLDLATVETGEDWYGIAQRVGVPTVELRMHNPFLAGRRLRAGFLVAYPKVPRGNLVVVNGDAIEYRVRYGDNYFHLAFSLDVDLDTLRASNDLWRLQSVLPGLMLRMPLAKATKFRDHPVQSGQTLGSIAEALQADAWLIIRDNGLFATDEVAPGTVLKKDPRRERWPPAGRGWTSLRSQRGGNRHVSRRARGYPFRVGTNLRHDRGGHSGGEWHRPADDAQDRSGAADSDVEGRRRGRSDHASRGTGRHALGSGETLRHDRDGDPECQRHWPSYHAPDWAGAADFGVRLHRRGVRHLCHAPGGAGRHAFRPGNTVRHDGGGHPERERHRPADDASDRTSVANPGLLRSRRVVRYTLTGITRNDRPDKNARPYKIGFQPPVVTSQNDRRTLVEFTTGPRNPLSDRAPSHGGSRAHTWST